MTFQQLMCEKDHNAKPMNYQCDIRRLTQLFNRPLQMKYFAKVQPDEKPKVHQQTLLNEEGELVNGPGDV